MVGLWRVSFWYIAPAIVYKTFPGNKLYSHYFSNLNLTIPLTENIEILNCNIYAHS